MILARLSLCSLLLAAAGCSSLAPPPNLDEPPPFEFRLGPGDRLFVSVWGEEKLGQECQIGPDGSAAFPLIGDVSLVGLSLDEARVELAQRLKANLVDPVVSLTLLEMRSHVIQVLGEVHRPGSVPYVRGATVLGAIQAAGGYRAESAELSEVRVIRSRLDQPQGYGVDLESVLAGEARDMWLRPGDVVFVPTRTVSSWERWWRQALPWSEPLPPR